MSSAIKKFFAIIHVCFIKKLENGYFEFEMDVLNNIAIDILMQLIKMMTY